MNDLVRVRARRAPRMRRAFTPTIAFVLLTSGFVTVNPSTAASAAEESAGETRAIGQSSRVFAGSGSTGNVTAPAAKARKATLDVMTTVEMPYGLYRANDVNGVGDIAGMTMAGADYHAALRVGETVHDLGTLENSAGNSSGLAINGLGRSPGTVGAATEASSTASSGRLTSRMERSARCGRFRPHRTGR
jgi:hypothetical protein